jgi:hypothetical protein
MFSSLLLFLSSSASTPDLSKTFLGNWSCTSESPDGSNSSAYIRVIPTIQRNFTVSVYETNETQSPLDTFLLLTDKTTTVQFGRNEISLQPINFSNNIRGHFSATGRWEGYVFTAVLARSSVITVTLVNEADGEHRTLYLAKDIDRTPPPWYKQWGQYIVLGVLFIASQGFSIWSQRNLAGKPPPPAPEAPNTALKTAPKVEEVKGEKEEEEEEEGEEKRPAAAGPDEKPADEGDGASGTGGEGEKASEE